MGAPISAVRVVAGLAATAVGAFFMHGKMERSELWRIEHDSFEREFDHNYMLAGHKIWAGTGIEKYVAAWEKQKHNGPWGIFKLGREWGHKISGFFNEVIWDPAAALALGGLYFAGIKPHKLLVSGYEAIKNSGVVQGTARKVWNWGKTFFNGSWTKAAFSKLFTAPGLLIAGSIAFALIQFEKVYNGNEQKDLFGNK